MIKRDGGEIIFQLNLQCIVHKWINVFQRLSGFLSAANYSKLYLSSKVWQTLLEDQGKIYKKSPKILQKTVF